MFLLLKMIVFVVFSILIIRKYIVLYFLKVFVFIIFLVIGVDVVFSNVEGCFFKYNL